MSMSRDDAIEIVRNSLIRARDELASRLGAQYGGDRRLMEVGGYKQNLRFEDFWDEYERNGVAGQIIDAAAETTWRTPPEITEENAPEGGSEFMKQWDALASRLHVWAAFEEADRLSRIGRYSVILIGTKGSTDDSLQRPLTRVDGPDALLYLSTFNEKQADIKTWVNRPSDERYGQPETYEIDLTSDIPNFHRDQKRATAVRLVHHSRVLHVADGHVFGRPVLKRIWNDLHDLAKVRTSTAEAFWQRVAGILVAEFAPDAMPTPEQLEALDTELRDLYHDLRRYIFGNFELKRLAETEPNPKEAAELYMTLISAGATPPMPKRILFGSETGERASTEDQKTWLGAIESRRLQVAEPRVLRPFIQRCQDIGALPRSDTYEIVWPSLYSVPEKEVAEANLARARAIQAVTPMAGDPSLLYEVDEDRNIWPVPRKAGEASPFEIEPVDPDAAADEPEGDEMREAA